MSRRTLFATALVGAVLSGGLALPHASADTLDDAYPLSADCKNYGDDTSDVHEFMAYGGGAPVNDPDLDLVNVAFHAGPAKFKAFVRVSDLADKPAYGLGHAFLMKLTFKAVSKTYTFTSARMPGVDAATADTSTGAPSSVQWKTTFDTTKNYVIFEIDRATMDAAVPGALAPDAQVVLNEIDAMTYVAPTQYYNADTLGPPLNSPPYKVGTDDVCWPPPPSTITNVGAVKSQFSDAATVKAKLVSASGTPLAGKTVTFTLAGKTATGTTDADGVASATLDPAATAATSYTLVAAFAGDGTAGAATVSTPFTVTTEATKLTLKVVKSGSARTVTATLKDDDGKVLAGQSVTWYINGKKVSTLKTSSAGQVVLKTAKPTQTVMAKFLGVSGKYAATSVSTKV